MELSELRDARFLGRRAPRSLKALRGARRSSFVDGPFADPHAEEEREDGAVLERDDDALLLLHRVVHDRERRGDVRELVEALPAQRLA